MSAEKTVFHHKIRKREKRFRKTYEKKLNEAIEEFFNSDQGNYLAPVYGRDEYFLSYIGMTMVANGFHLKKSYRKIWAFLFLKGRSAPEWTAKHLGVSNDWIYRFIDDVNKRGMDAVKEDERQTNGKKPSVVTPQVIAAVCKAIKRPSPDGFHWKGHHVHAFLVAELRLQTVSKTTAYEVLKLAKNINRKNSA